MTYSNTPKGEASGPGERLCTAIEKAAASIAAEETHVGAPLALHDYEHFHHAASRPALHRLQFSRPIAASQDFMERAVVDAEWLFRQPVAARYAAFDLVMDVETLAYPSEAMLALEQATDSAFFHVEELSRRAAGVGEGEGPYLTRPADRRLRYFDQLKSEFLYDETAKTMPNALGAQKVCNLLGIPLTRMANLVESGVVRKHRPWNLSFNKAMGETWVMCWGQPDLEALERELMRGKVNRGKGEGHV